MTQLPKAHVISSVRVFLAAFAISLLAACGGGGGGGGSLPSKLAITNPAAPEGDVLDVLAADEAVEIAFNEGVTLDTAETLDVNLNGHNVSAYFVITEAGDGSITAKADVFALSAALMDTASGGSTPLVEAKVDGSRTESRQFAYQGRPEIVVNSVTGGTAEGYNPDTFTYDGVLYDGNDADYNGNVAPYQTTNSELPQSSDPLVVSGVARGDLLASLQADIGVSTGVVMPAVLDEASGSPLFDNGRSYFQFSPFTYEIGATGIDSPDFVFTGTSDDGVAAETLEIVAPGTMLNNMLALQLNDSAFNRVIGKWLGEVIKSRLGQISEASPVVLLPATGTSGSPDDVCQVINQYKDDVVHPDDFYECDVQLLKVGTQNDINIVPDFEVTAVTSALPLDSTLDSGWHWDVTVAAQQPVKMKLRFTAYDGTGTEAETGYLQINANFQAASGDSTPPSLTVRLNVGADGAVGASLLGIEIDGSDDGDGTYSTTAISAQQYLQNLSDQECTVCESGFSTIGLASAAGGQITNAITDLAGEQAWCLQPYTVDYVYTDGSLESACGFADPGLSTDRRLVEDSGAVTVPVENEQYLVTPDDAGTPDVDETQYLVISAMETMFSKLDYQVANDGAADVGGFVGLQGYSKTVDNGVHLNALGSVFTTPLSGEGKVDAGNIDAGSDVSLAVSSNWFNQLLLSMHQSNVFSTIKPNPTVGDLGDLGLELANNSLGYITTATPVDISVSGKTPGAMRFVQQGEESNIYVGMPQLTLKIVLQSDLSPLADQINGTTIDDPRTATVESYPSPCAAYSYQAISNLEDGKYAYVEVNMDVKARMPVSLDANNELQLTPANDDLMLFVSSADGTTIRLPDIGSCDVLFEPSRTELQAMLPEFVNPFLQTEVSELLQPGEETLCIDTSVTGIQNEMLRNIFADFFDDGAGGSRDRVMELVLGNVSAEGEHLLLSASAREQGDTSEVTGNAFYSLVLTNDMGRPECQ